MAKGSKIFPVKRFVLVRCLARASMTRCSKVGSVETNTFMLLSALFVPMFKLELPFFNDRLPLKEIELVAILPLQTVNLYHLAVISLAYLANGCNV